MEGNKDQRPSAAERLVRMEKAWLDSSTPEDFYFSLRPDVPKPLRRSTVIKGALAELTFGRYQDLDGSWVQNDVVVWLGMIVSEAAGAGSQLLEAICKGCGRSGLVLMGTPTPLKPRDWCRDEKFDFNQRRLINWYMRHGFRVLQNASTTRLVFSVQSSRLAVAFSINPDSALPAAS